MSIVSTFIEAWKNRAQLGESKRNAQELDFLPAALEILERPPSPLGKLLGRTLMALVGIGIVWACVGEIDVTAVAEGKIISSGRVKDIQPLEKGVVKTIYVKEGQLVAQGQPLVELDQTLTTAEKIRLSQELHFTQLNYLREKTFLKTLQNQNEHSVALGADGGGSAQALLKLDTAGQSLSVTEHLTQTQLLEQQWLNYQSRVSTLQSQRRERQAALQANEAQLSQLEQVLPLITRRADALKQLVAQELVPEMTYLELEQERIERQQALAISRAEYQQNLAAIETAAQQLNTLKAEAVRESLTQVDEYQRQLQSLTQELAKAQDVEAKQILYAPVAGTVHQLAVYTVGGVVTEAQVLMTLVPQNDFLEVEATLENKDVGFVFEGQPAEIKINTFNFTKYGVIDAEVAGVTADAVVDEAKGLVYKLRLKMKQTEIKIDGRMVDLLPGMTVMAEVKTGKRKLIEYVLSPLMRKADESVRER